MQYVLVLDVPGIKNYVFNTERLVEIRGASGLLDDLNRRKTDEFLQKRLGANNVECIYAGGGGAQFLITANPDELQSAVRELKGLFHRDSRGGLRLISGWAELQEGNYKKCLTKAFASLNREKEEAPILPSSPLQTGFVRECDSCSAPAALIGSHAGASLILCAACHEKINFAKNHRGLWREFAVFLEQKGVTGVSRPRDFEEVARTSAKKGYLALVYADGNSMGKVVKSIDSPECFRHFSRTVDESIREACHEALLEECINRGGAVDILLLGGDDLLICLNADAALPFALAVSRKFEEKTTARFAANASLAPRILNGRGITLSFGVVYSKSHTPFSLLLEQAEELLKSAKKGGSVDHRCSACYAPSYIDFHYQSRYNQVSVDESRKRFLTLRSSDGELFLHQKPYSLESATLLLGQTQKLLRLGIPRSRLKRLAKAPFLGKNAGALESLKLVGRTRMEEQRLALWETLDAFGCGELIPWCREEKGFSTMLTDLVELAEFIPSGGKEVVADA